MVSNRRLTPPYEAIPLAMAPAILFFVWLTRDLSFATFTREPVFAGYSLFWSDPVTGCGEVEPVRTEDAHQRRGLAQQLPYPHGLAVAQLAVFRLFLGIGMGGEWASGAALVVRGV